MQGARCVDEAADPVAAFQTCETQHHDACGSTNASMLPSLANVSQMAKKVANMKAAKDVLDQARRRALLNLTPSR